jgi:hypothetical protein
VDSPDLQRVRAVEREDAAVRAFELRIDDPADAGGGGEKDKEDGETATEHSERLLASTAWKSKRLVSTGRQQ